MSMKAYDGWMVLVHVLGLIPSIIGAIWFGIFVIEGNLPMLQKKVWNGERSDTTPFGSFMLACYMVIGGVAWTYACFALWP